MAAEDIPPEILRRITFAAAYLPSDCPRFWEIVSKFAVLESSKEDLTPEKVKLIVENLQVLHEEAFTSDKALVLELQAMNYGQFKPLGLVLVSSNQNCRECGGKLLLRGDRPSKVAIYTGAQGTLLGSHFVKYCQNSRKGCNFSQHYGYHTLGDTSISYYDKNWNQLPYSLSTNQTAFEMKLFERFDVELLIGELSYKQKSEIYNCMNGYDDVQKKCASLELLK